MILSRLRKFVFIKGLKVAGTSVEMALSQVCGSDDIITPITPIDERTRVYFGRGACNYSGSRTHEDAYLRDVVSTPPEYLAAVRAPAGGYFNHMTLAAVEQLCDGVPDHRVLCVVRNPYTKIISWANWVVASKRYETGGRIQTETGLVATRLIAMIEDRSIASVLDIQRYRNRRGEFAAEMLRFENLAADYTGFVSSLGISDAPDLPHAKKGPETLHRLILENLSARHVQTVNEIFEDEFRSFGYPML